MSCSIQRVPAFVPNRSLNDKPSAQHEPWVCDRYSPAQPPLLSSSVFPSEEFTCLLLWVGFRTGDAWATGVFPQWCPVLSRLWLSNTMHLCHLFGALGGTCPCSRACTSLLLTKTHVSSYSFLFPSLTQVLDIRKSGITVEQLTSDFLYDYKFHLVWESLKAEFKMHIFSCFFTVISH